VVDITKTLLSFASKSIATDLFNLIFTGQNLNHIVFSFNIAYDMTIIYQFFFPCLEKKEIHFGHRHNFTKKIYIMELISMIFRYWRTNLTTLITNQAHNTTIEAYLALASLINDQYSFINLHTGMQLDVRSATRMPTHIPYGLYFGAGGDTIVTYYFFPGPFLQINSLYIIVPLQINLLSLIVQKTKI
ncbi:hypothetical protein ACJX0J_019766, partial [Zea mays]